MVMSLWKTAAAPRRFFLLPDGVLLPAGALELAGSGSTLQHVDPASVQALEITEEQAHRWARDQLGATLDELKHGIDGRLAALRAHAPVRDDTLPTSDVGAALLAFLKQLPGVVGGSLAQDANQVASATAAMAKLQQRLQDAGIDVDDRLTDFPGRLAALRAEALKQNN